MIIQEIVPRVYQLGAVSGSGLWGGNVFLLADDNITLVDTGYKGGAFRILAILDEYTSDYFSKWEEA